MTGHDAAANGWHKSKASGSGSCVEVRFAAEHVHVRDTKDKHGPILTFTHAEWRAFLTGVRLDEFDAPVD